jgi:HD-GYP domain-containing protein (c-di-GMP phosphodiesterase class II)
MISAYEATIEGWARALDLRDKETEGRSRRVNEMTVRVARALGVSESELVHIRRGPCCMISARWASPTPSS